MKAATRTPSDMSIAVSATATILCTAFAVSGTMLLLTGDKVRTRLLALLGTLALITGACIAFSAWMNGGAGASGLLAHTVHAALPFWLPPNDLRTARWSPYWAVIALVPVVFGYLLSQVCEAVPDNPQKGNAPDPTSPSTAASSVCPGKSAGAN
jgi:hypothetical protein